MTKPWQFIIISLTFVALTIGLIIGISRTQFSTSVIDLLPNDRTDYEILQEFAEQGQGRLLTLHLFSEQDPVSPAAEAAFLRVLRSSPHFENVWLADSSALNATAENLFKNRYQWMLPKWLEIHFQDWSSNSSITSDELAERVIEQMDHYLASPGGIALVNTIPSDPFILMELALDSTDFLNQSLKKVGLNIWARQLASPFSSEGQKPVFEAVEAAYKAACEEMPNLKMEYSGVSRFAAASKEGIKEEIERLNLLALILVFIVTAFWVRSFRTTLNIFFVLAVALAAAVTTVLLAFPTVHIISLVIGSILTGIAVDYAFHLLLKERRGLESWAVTRAVVTGSTSSTLGFILLLWAPLPFLKQVGAFVGSGLIAALLTALLIRPAQPNATRQEPWLLNPFSMPAWTGILLVLISVPGLFFIVWKDSIYDLEYPLPELKASEERLRWKSPTEEQQSVYLIHGSSLTSARKRLQELHLKEEHSELLHLGTWIADLKTARSAHQFFKDKTEFTAVLLQKLEYCDYHTEAFKPFLESWSAYIDSEINDTIYDDLLTQFAATLPGPLASLLHKGQQHSWFMALSPHVLQPLSADGVIQLDQASILSEAFSSYRKTIISFGGFCLLGLSIGVLFIYGPALGAAALVIPTIAVFSAYGILGYFGAEMSLFHVVGTLLAFCISLDYSLFGVVAHQRHFRLPASVSISAATTLGAFAILSSSKIPAIQQLSTTILIIISMNLLLIMAGWPWVRRGAVPSRWCFRKLPHGLEAYFIKSTQTISEHHIETICDPQLANHYSPEWIIEAMAQSAALLLAYNKTTEKQPRFGMLVVVQEFKLPPESSPLPTKLYCEIESLSENREGLLVFKGSCIDNDNTVLAESHFSIFIPAEEGSSISKHG